MKIEVHREFRGATAFELPVYPAGSRSLGQVVAGAGDEDVAVAVHRNAPAHRPIVHVDGRGPQEVAAAVQLAGECCRAVVRLQGDIALSGIEVHETRELTRQVDVPLDTGDAVAGGSQCPPKSWTHWKAPLLSSFSAKASVWPRAVRVALAPVPKVACPWKEPVT